MKQYQSLMEQIRDEFCIFQGDTEAEEEYKTRIVYSLLGRMGYASLGDTQEDTGAATIVHFKRRINAILSSYLRMYPELTRFLPREGEELSNELYQLFLDTGCLYYMDRHLTPASPTAAYSGGIYFVRGMALNKRQRVSGAGTYTEKTDCTRIVTPKEMFGLQEDSLHEAWENLLQRADWKPFNTDAQMEFLKMEPPYKGGYWVEKPNKIGQVSLMRTRSLISPLYYLYRCEGGKMIASPIPDWMATEHRYRMISNACLHNYELLPAAHYEKNGAVVQLHLKYLYPPAELNLIRLYSWPMKYWSFPSNFHRVLNTEVFQAICETLEPIGYKFVEG